MAGLREVAESDLGFILESDETGFRWPVIITSPDGTIVGDDPENLLYGFSDDIAQIIDPDTGQAVNSRLISVALRISTLIARGLTIPTGVLDVNSKLWTVSFNDLQGVSHNFAIQSTNPDRALGLVVCILEHLKV